MLARPLKLAESRQAALRNRHGQSDIRLHNVAAALDLGLRENAAIVFETSALKTSFCGCLC